MESENKQRKRRLHSLLLKRKKEIYMLKQTTRRVKVAQKTTNEIRRLLSSAKLDFESVQNQALNAYLPKIFHSCPLTEDICQTKQCMDCVVFKNAIKE
jgi:hypothetical protein